MTDTPAPPSPNPIVGYFQIGNDPVMGDYIIAVLKSFWDANGHLDDQSSEQAFLPPGLSEVAAATYEHTYPTIQDARAALISAGFIEKTLFP